MDGGDAPGFPGRLLDESTVFTVVFFQTGQFLNRPYLVWRSVFEKDRRLGGRPKCRHACFQYGLRLSLPCNIVITA